VTFDLRKLKAAAETEGVALNQFINVAVAEKISALRTEDYFRERSTRASLTEAKRILKPCGKRQPTPPRATKSNNASHSRPSS